jgi:hypothetical protein
VKADRVITATTFSRDDVKVMWSLLERAMRSRDPVASTKAFARLARKVLAMKSKQEAGDVQAR